MWHVLAAAFAFGPSLTPQHGLIGHHCRAATQPATPTRALETTMDVTASSSVDTEEDWSALDEWLGQSRASGDELVERPGAQRRRWAITTKGHVHANFFHQGSKNSWEDIGASERVTENLKRLGTKHAYMYPMSPSEIDGTAMLGQKPRWSYLLGLHPHVTTWGFILTTPGLGG